MGAVCAAAAFFEVPEPVSKPEAEAAGELNEVGAEDPDALRKTRSLPISDPRMLRLPMSCRRRSRARWICRIRRFRQA